MTAVELAQILDVSLSVVQKALDSLIKKGLVETTLPVTKNDGGETTLSVDEFNQLQSEWITRTIPDDLLKAQQIIGIEMVVDKFGFENLHAPFEVTPDQLYNFCDEIYGGDSQHVRAVPKSI